MGAAEVVPPVPDAGLQLEPQRRRDPSGSFIVPASANLLRSAPRLPAHQFEQVSTLQEECLCRSVCEQQCLCDAGYYNEQPASAGTVSCVLCPAEANCQLPGVTLEDLPLKRGYYRISTMSTDLRRCPDFGDASGCIGGVSDGEGPCKPWLRGPYCRVCNDSDTSRYYDASESACLPCDHAVSSRRLRVGRGGAAEEAERARAGRRGSSVGLADHRAG